MKKISDKKQIGTDTYFAYIRVNMESVYSEEFYIHANDFRVITAYLLKQYLLVFVNKVSNGEWGCKEVNDLNIREVIERIDDAGFGLHLRMVIPRLCLVVEKICPEEVKDYADDLRSFMDNLGDALTFTLCGNLVEFCQFLRQSKGDMTVEELFDDC